MEGIEIMKRILSLTLILCFILSIFSIIPANASEVLTYGVYEYVELDDGTVKITKYNGTDVGVIIPNAINGKNVSVIGEEAFFNNYKMEFVYLPKFLKEIESGAFYYCRELNKITIPKTLEKCGSAAFGNTDICSVEFPSGMTKVPDGMFYYSKLTLDNVTFPDSITEIGEQAFSYMTINSITLPKNLKIIGKDAFSYSTINNITISKTLETINEHAFVNSEIQNASFEYGIKVIPKEMFMFCYGLTKVTLPNTVTEISDKAFYSCKSLSSINLSTNLEKIGTDAFMYCESLKEITIPASITEIDYYPFERTGLQTIKFAQGTTKIPKYICERAEYLENVVLPNTVKEIGMGAFRDTKIKTIDIPDSVEFIDTSAFAGCTDLTSVELPSSLTKLGGTVFSGCNSLKYVKIPASLKECGGYLTSGSGPEKVEFEEGTKEIFDSMLANSGNLVEVVIPSSVEKIGKWSFSDCKKLSRISSLKNVKYIDNYAF